MSTTITLRANRTERRQYLTPTTTAPENIVANFIEPADPNRDYVHWRNFLRQWWVLGPFSFAERAYATDDPARALNDHFIADEALLVLREDEEITGCIWRRYSAVSVMNKWCVVDHDAVPCRGGQIDIIDTNTISADHAQVRSCAEHVLVDNLFRDDCYLGTG